MMLSRKVFSAVISELKVFRCDLVLFRLKYFRCFDMIDFVAICQSICVLHER